MISRTLLTLCWMMVLLSVVAGCCRKAVSTTTTEVTDSIYEKEVTRLIPVVIPGETVTLRGLIECDPVTNKPKPYTGEVKGEQAKLTVNIDSSGALQASGGYDSLRKELEARDREITRMRTEKTVKTVPVYRTRKFDIFCRWWFAITALIIIATIFHKLKNF